MPHEVTGELCKQTTILIKQFACSCKAGASQCCKHIVAVLLLLNRQVLKYY